MGLGLLFGILVLVLGVSLVLHTLFDVRVPLFRTAFGLTLVYLGVRVLLGAWMPVRSAHGARDAVFSASRFVPRTEDELAGKYDVVFGRGVVDLTHIGRLDGDRMAQVDVVFGEGIVELDPSMPVEVRGSSVFGEVRMPDDARANFGEVGYRSRDTGAPASGRLLLRVNAVFGTATVRLRGHVAGSDTAPTTAAAQ